ncbi:hypothetical protein LPJ61_006705 [Coemansia biformis]|uniref:Uncharacterized protein n=1 Tax=Coemansia biformis TaxID=1286918 RepID=A0A9W7XPN3_9FUNG|nr:hypothetical protein LPJ61_006705 [Coemansia biformis]
MHKAEQSRQAEENLQRLISGPHTEWGAAKDDVSSPPPQDPGATSGAAAAEGPAATESPPAIEGPAVTSDVHAKHHAHQRVTRLFPPPNYRVAGKRARLADFIR